MIQVALAFALTCPTPIIENQVEKTYSIETEADAKTLKHIQNRCGQIYKDSPCAKKVIIKLDPWGDRAYSVVCGQKSLKEDNPYILRGKDAIIRE